MANSPLLWLVALILLVAAAFGLQGWLELREVRRSAREDHAYRAGRGMRGGEVALDTYEDAYVRVHAPRKQLHIAFATAAMALLTPVMLRVADILMTLVWRLTGESRVFEPTFLVYQFGLFFLMIAFWAFIALATARHYHRGFVERVENILYDDIVEHPPWWKDLPIIMGILFASLSVIATITMRVLN